MGLRVRYVWCMKTLLVALSMVLMGCEGTASYACSDDVFAEARYSVPTDCAQSRRVTALALKTMSESGMWAHPNLKSLTLTVYDVPNWKDPVDENWVDGIWTPGSIEVGVTYGALVHEMFHAKDRLDLDIARGLAPMHQGWDTDGRDALGWKWRAAVAAMLDAEK